MAKFLFFLLLIGLTSVLAQDVNPPEFKLAFDYRVIELIKKNIVKPLVQRFTQNLTIDKTFTIQAGVISGELGNVTISDLSLDWDNSHLLILSNRGTPFIIIHNLSFAVKFDAGASYLKHGFVGRNNHMVVEDALVTIDLGFGSFPNETSYIFIENAVTTINSMKLHLSNPILEILLKASKLFGMKLEHIAGTFVQNGILELNDTLVHMTTQGIQFGLLDLLDVHVSLADLPFSYFVNRNSHQAISFNLDVTNMQTQQRAPVAPADVMPDYIGDDYATQLLVSQSMIGQILWGLFETELIKFELSNKRLPEKFPISFNTSNLDLFFPNILREYGYGKGVYLSLDKGGSNPLIFITDGRINAVLNFELKFWVDTDSSQYPDQGLKNCTTCVKAYHLSTNIFAGMVLYEKNATHIGLKLMDLQLNELQVLSGDVDGVSLSNIFNTLFPSLLLQINTKLAGGIQNPILGVLGVNATSLTLGTDYLFVGLSFGPSDDLLII